MLSLGFCSVVPGCKRDHPITTKRVAIWFETRAFPLTVHPLPRFAEVAHRALAFTSASSGCVSPLSSRPPHHRAYPVPSNERLCREPRRPSQIKAAGRIRCGKHEAEQEAQEEGQRGDQYKVSVQLYNASAQDSTCVKQ